MNANFKELKRRIDGALQGETEYGAETIVKLEEILSVAFEDGLLSLPATFRNGFDIEVNIAPEVHSIKIAVDFDTKVVV